ncbi:hypothetical protein C8R41DRAFT_927440 [Lentinula lateritia]|uniref:Uncharacterized protein n=1 Tax=Lentinula lateritia TaxID=40482 RepID=A0ABQ8UVZ9_9AGAR|nr:hypothetical protein C8R41DRAFT_927440 [Lentinula lateritia]
MPSPATPDKVNTENNANKKAWCDTSQSAHQSPGHSLPSLRKVPSATRNLSRTPLPRGSQLCNLLIPGHASEEEELGPLHPIPQPHFLCALTDPVPRTESDPSDPFVDHDIPITGPPSPEKNLSNLLAPSLEKERERKQIDQSDENPHLQPVPALELEQPSDIEAWRVFTQNTGQFERIILDFPFLYQGHSDETICSIQDQSDKWVAIMPINGGRYLFSHSRDIFDKIESTLAEAGCSGQILPPEVPELPSTAIVNLTKGQSMANTNTAQDSFGPPYAAFLSFDSFADWDKILRQQSFAKSKLVAFHAIPVINKLQKWVVGHFWTTVKRYNDETKANMMFVIKNYLFHSNDFRHLIQLYSTIKGPLDEQVTALLDMFDLRKQEYEFKKNDASQYQWVLFAAPTSMNPNLAIREFKEEQICSFIRSREYRGGIYHVKAAPLYCAMCKSWTHNYFACYFATSPDWHGPKIEERIKVITEEVKKDRRRAQRGTQAKSNGHNHSHK